MLLKIRRILVLKISISGKMTVLFIYIASFVLFAFMLRLQFNKKLYNALMGQIHLIIILNCYNLTITQHIAWLTVMLVILALL